MLHNEACTNLEYAVADLFFLLRKCQIVFRHYWYGSNDLLCLRLDYVVMPQSCTMCPTVRTGS